MKKWLQRSLSFVLCMVSIPAFAYMHTTKISFCPQSDKVMGRCSASLLDGELWNFLGGNLEECYIENQQGTIVAEKKFFDGHPVLPRGVVILFGLNRYIFPEASPLVNFREFCTHFRDGKMWRFPWSTQLNYVVKEAGALGLEDMSAKQSCASHEPGGPGGNPP